MHLHSHSLTLLCLTNKPVPFTQRNVALSRYLSCSLQSPVALRVPDAAPQPDDGGLLRAARRQVRRYTKGKRAEEDASDAGEPVGAHLARAADGVPRLGGSPVTGHAAATLTAAASRGAAAPAAPGTGVHALAR